MGIMLSPLGSANEVYVKVTGTGIGLSITQDGDNNQVGTSTDKFSVNGNSNTMYIWQEGQWNQVFYVSAWGTGNAFGGDVNGNNNDIKIEQFNTTGTDVNKVGMHISTSDNNVHVCQGKSFTDAADTTCSASSTAEYGGHTVNLDLHSGGNDIKISQETGTGNANHFINIYTYGGENNDVFIKQKGNGNKYAMMTIRTDGGTQSIVQKDDGAHSATIDLTGSYHTDLNLIQYGSTDQTYTLTNNCQTAGGCTVSLIQN
mgnify:FL=1